MKVAELTRRLNVPYRDVRYVLERGILPRGVEESPGKGEHRDLTPLQAFWLAVVLKLKQNGVRTPLARRIADLAKDGIQGMAANAGWDWNYNPFQGRFETEYDWYVDLGDLSLIRIATTAYPSKEGLYESPWVEIRTRREAKGAAPLVVIRLDIARLGRLLQN